MIRETVAGDFGRLDYAATGNKVVGCAWLTSLLQLIDYERITMSTAPIPNHVHEGIIIRWVDGDTLYIMADMDFRHYGKLECRLIGINTPERGQIDYKEATLEANHLAPVGSTVIFRSEKDPEKWGRWLVELWANDVDVDEALIASGLGVAYFGGKR